MTKIKCKYLLNLLITAQIGDTVEYESYNEESKIMLKQATIIKITTYEYIYKINQHGIEIGFHKSRLKKIIRSRTGQTQLFNY